MMAEPRHGGRISSEITSLTVSRTQGRNPQGMGVFWNLKSCLRWHTFSNKAMPRNNSPITTNGGASIQIAEACGGTSHSKQNSNFPHGSNHRLLMKPLPLHSCNRFFPLRIFPRIYLQVPKHVSSSLVFWKLHVDTCQSCTQTPD